jgi:adenylosuccinate lyase
MPHKMNSRSCERLNGFAVILKGYLTMAGELAGDQWNEGDVSCSVVRRVFLPDSFFRHRRIDRYLPHDPESDGSLSRRD